MNRANLQQEVPRSSSSMTALSDNSSDLDKRRASQSQSYKVTWDDPDDPENPRNWANRRRWTVTLVVSLFTFISPVASSISSPSLPQISTRFQIPAGSILEDMSLSIFVLAYAIGPLFWGPLSELYGRLIILQSSNMFFLLFNTVCAFANNSTQLLVFRFLAGLGGAAPQSVGGAVVGDLWAPEERGSAMALYSLAPLVGPATGPLVGGWIAERSRWQWVFWSVSIADAILQIVAFFTVRETYGPIILSRRAKHLSNLRHDVEKSPSLGVVAPPRQSLGDVMLRGMVRPFIFLATEPIVQVFALYMAVLYGLLYLTLVHYVNVYTNQYSQSEGIAGLHYLSIALGSTVGGQIGARTLNYLYRYLKAKNNGVGTPEMRLPLLMVTATTLPIGLLIYGWAVQAHTHWIIPDIGVFIFSIGIGGNWTCIQTYLVDSYAIYAASAIAGVTSFRAFAGFGFPLFQDKLYGSLGDGWGNSLLALICLVIGCPAPFIFYKYGPVLRAKGKGDAQGL